MNRFAIHDSDLLSLLFSSIFWSLHLLALVNIIVRLFLYAVIFNQIQVQLKNRESVLNLDAYLDLQPGLRVGQWNVNHLNDSRLEEIKLALLGADYTETRLDVLVINETFWDSTTSSEFFSIPRFNLFRRDRVRKAGGGIVIYVNQFLLCKATF